MKQPIAETTALTAFTAGIDALQSAQRGFAAFGTAQELMVKAMMRAATRQAELARETLSDGMSATAALRLATNPQDGQEQMRRASLAAETWWRTWQSITDDFGRDMMAAADVILSATPLRPRQPATSEPATTRPAAPFARPATAH